MNILWIGVDMASKTFTASVWDSQKEQSCFLAEFSNDAKGFVIFCSAIAPHQRPDQATKVVLESTGGYGKRFISFARQQQWQICLPNAKLVRDFANSYGQRNKNDREDANMLAHYGAARQPSFQEALADELVELDQLQRRRQQLEKQLRSEKLRLKQWEQQPITNSDVAISLHTVMECLEAQLCAVTDAVNAILNKHAAHKAMLKRLRTVPGVGPKNSLPLLLFLHRYRARSGTAGSRKGVVAYCGLDPQEFSSGTSIRKRATISKMGDKVMRHYLYMGALGGTRGNNALRHFYRALVERGKAKRLGLTAAARKILVWAYAIFSTETDFDPSMHPFPNPVS